MLKEAIQHAIQLFPLLSRQNHVTSQFLASSCICTACDSISISGTQDLPYNALQCFETYRQAACNIFSHTSWCNHVSFFWTCGMLVIFEACFVQKAFYRYALAMGSTLSIFVFRYKYFLPPATHAMGWYNNRRVAIYAWLIYAFLVLAKLCDYALLYLRAGKWCYIL